MRIRLPWVAAAVLGVGLAPMPAGASESRVVVFSIACDGTSKHVEFSASRATTNATQFIQGAEATVLDTRGALRGLVVKLQDDDTKELISVGPGETQARTDYTGFIQVAVNAAGKVPISIDATCTPGAPLQGVVSVLFFS